MTQKTRNMIWSACAAVALTGLLGLSAPRQLLAQVTATLIKDVDNPDRQPFQATLQVGALGTWAGAQIPTGKRLVVESVSVSSSSFSAAKTQPIVILNSTVAGSSSINFYLYPAPNAQVASQFQFVGPITLRSDQLYVGLGYTGATPTSTSAGVVLTGHLVDINP